MTSRRDPPSAGPPAGSPAADAPYAGLTPDVVLDALDCVGLRGDGRLLQLNSYENRVFQVFLEDRRVVVAKFYRPGRWSDAQILEEHGFATQLAAEEIPVVPPLVLEVDSDPRLPTRLCGAASTLAEVLAPVDGATAAFRFSVSERCAGNAPELDDESNLEWIGRFIGRIHAIGRLTPFQHRRRFDIATFGQAPRDWLLGHNILAPDVLPAWKDTVDHMLLEAARLFNAAGDVAQIRVHGDCHPGNVLWSTDGPHFVDLDDAVTGPAIQDLWMLLSGDRASMTRQLGALLAGYECFMDFDPRELALIEALRGLRMLHHSAWIAQRWTDPAFPQAFPWFGNSSYWAQQTTQFREQIEAMREAPLSFYPAD